MMSTIIAALLPMVVTLLLGFLAGWRHDFDTKQAAVLNSMVMLYALPLNLFAGMVGMSRDQVLSQGPLAAAILLGMAGGYAIAFLQRKRSAPISVYRVRTASLKGARLERPVRDTTRPSSSM